MGEPNFLALAGKSEHLNNLITNDNERKLKTSLIKT